jgi:carbamoyl-phosphate synthase large subunit
MSARLLVMGAGTGAGNAFIRSVTAGDRSLGIVGCHDDRFVLKGSLAPRNYLLPASHAPRFAPALRRVIEAERVDLVVPTSDGAIGALARQRAWLGRRVFLPRSPVLRLCRDKYALAVRLAARGVPVPVTYPVTGLDRLAGIFRRLRSPARAWCRVRTGSASLAAGPVTGPEQARAWIRYWATTRGVPVTAFTLSEYLPGRDFFAQGLWKDGALVLVKTCERVSYWVGGSQPSGVSSVSHLAKTVRAPAVVEVCAAAIRAIDRAATGTFNFDLKENAAGIPCLTEINAGRFPSGTRLLEVGKHNLAAAYVRLALGDAVDVGEPYDVADDYYSVRDLDTLAGLYHADELFEGIEDAR